MAKLLTPPTNSGLVARWIISTVQAKGEISRRELIDGVIAKFGNDYLQVSKIGRVSFAGPVVDSLRRIGKGLVAYDRSRDVWRMRDAR